MGRFRLARTLAAVVGSSLVLILSTRVQAAIADDGACDDYDAGYCDGTQNTSWCTPVPKGCIFLGANCMLTGGDDNCDAGDYCCHYAVSM